MLNKFCEGTAPDTSYKVRQASILWNTKLEKRNKHREVCYNVCRRAVNIAVVKLEYGSQPKMMGDFLTKQIEAQKFNIVEELIPTMDLFNGTV